MIIPFAEFRPDVSDFKSAGKYTADVLNVLPRGDGYGPFPSMATVGTSLPEACRGFFYAHKNDGSVACFAGTSDKLYLLDNTTLTFSEVTRSSTTPYAALSATHNWQFEQFNKYVIAVQQNVSAAVSTA